MSNKNPRTAKITADGKISVKLPEDEWLTIEKALRKRIALTKNNEIEDYLWFLLEEVLNRLEQRRKTAMQFRCSEFFALFCPDTFQWVDQPTAMIIDDLFEPIRKNCAAYTQIQHGLINQHSGIVK